MTQIGESISAPNVDQPENKKPQKCDWSKCKDLHENKIDYPNNGVIARQGTAIRDALMGADMQPWKNGGHGVASKPIYLDHGDKVVPRTEYRSDGLMYSVQGHHLIPIELIGETKTLKDNAVLAGWDINGVANGILLPAYDADVAIHELQQHNGSHGAKYTEPIKDRLDIIEQRYETACSGQESHDFSAGLLASLSALAMVVKRKLLAIRKHGSGAEFWSLHNNSLDVFKNSIRTYNDRKRRYLAQGNG